MGQSNSQQKKVIAREHQIEEPQTQQKYILNLEGKTYNMLDYFSEGQLNRFNIICRQIMRYLIQKNIEFSRENIALLIQQSYPEQEDLLQAFIDRIKNKNCVYVMFHQLSSGPNQQQLGIENLILQNKQLIKINLYYQGMAPFNYETLQLFNQMIHYYEQSNTLQEIYFQIQANTIKIDCENQFFQAEVSIYNFTEQDNFSKINLLPLKSKCKFKVIHIHIDNRILDNLPTSILNFLQVNENILEKFKITTNQFQHDTLNAILQKITQINKEYKTLDDFQLYSIQKISQSQFKIHEYVTQNQNMSIFLVSKFGIQQKVAMVDLQQDNTLQVEQFIQQIIQSCSKIQMISFQEADIYAQCQFLQNFGVGLDRRIKLKLDINQMFTPQQVIKLLKQLSYCNQFEIVLEKLNRKEVNNQMFCQNLQSYQNQINLYIMICIIIKKQFQELLYHKAEYSFIDLYIDQ